MTAGRGRVRDRARAVCWALAVWAPFAAAPAWAAGPRADRSILWRAEQGESEGWMPEAARGEPAGAPAVDVQQVDLALTVDFGAQTISGTETFTMASLADGLDRVTLSLHDSLDVARVTLDGRDQIFSHAAQLLETVFDTTFAPGESFDLAVEYAGHPAPYATKGLKFDHHVTTDLLYTLSTPYSTSLVTIIPISSRWRPCVERADDKTTASFHVTVPAGFKAAANGVLTAVTAAAGGATTWHWSTAYPIAPYLVSFAVTNYDTLSDVYLTQEGGSMSLTHYVFPEHAATALEAYSRVPEMIGVLAARFGEYPFVGEKYGMASIVGNVAVENQTMTAMPANFIRIDHAYDWIILHELAHSWWGDAVTVADWTDVWLSEGFASYSEALWFEATEGAESMRSWMETMDTVPYPGTLADPDYIWVRTVYDKGAWVLHMLRHVMGDSVFFAAMRDYQAAHRYGNVTTADFQAAMEARYGGSLEWFVDPWVRQSGTPRYAWSWDSTPLAGAGYEVRLELRQTQDPAEPLFPMPVDVRVVTASGEENFTVWNDARQESFTFTAAAAPTDVLVDPDHWILREFDSFPTGVAEGEGVPAEGGMPALALRVHPNPARRASTIAWALAEAGEVRVELVDVAGRRVRAWSVRESAAGPGHVTWDGRDERGEAAPAGLYFARVSAGGETRAAKLILLR